MGNKKDSITNETAQRYSDFASNVTFYNDIIEVIQDSKEPMSLNEAIELLEKCMVAYFDMLEDKLCEDDFALIHDAALRLILSNEEGYRSRTYGEIFEKIDEALKAGKGNGFANFKNAEAIRILNALSDDYRLILFKLFLLESYVKEKRYHEFSDILARYTALIAFDASQGSAFYNSKEFKELTHKLVSAERGETSHSDEVKEKRKALIEEIRTRTLEIMKSGDTREYYEIAETLVGEINARTEQEIEDKLKKAYPKWKGNTDHEDKLDKETKKLSAALKISSRNARSAARNAADELKRARHEPNDNDK